jgi:hypothetical protein
MEILRVRNKSMMYRMKYECESLMSVWNSTQFKIIWRVIQNLNIRCWIIN